MSKLRELMKEAVSPGPREFHVDALRGALVRQDADLVEYLWRNAEAIAKLIDAAEDSMNALEDDSPLAATDFRNALSEIGG